MDADEASRLFHEDSEWQLNPTIFEQVCDTFGRPVMDLFASRLNWLIKPYCAWQPDPEAEVIDAFTISWGGQSLLCLPTFCIGWFGFAKVGNG